MNESKSHSLPISNYRTLWQLVLESLKLEPVRLSAVWTLMLINSLVSGAGILLLIPLLSAAGIPFEGAATSDAGILDRLPLQNFNLISILSLYCLLIFSTAFLNHLQVVLAAKLNARFVAEKRTRIYQLLLAASWRHLSEGSVGDYTRLLTNQVGTVGVVIQHMLTLTRAAILFLVLATLSFLVAPVLTAMTVTSALVLFAVIWPVNGILRESSLRRLQHNRKLFKLTIDQIANAKVIKSYGAESSFLKKVINSTTAHDLEQVRLTSITSLTRVANMTVVALTFAIVFYVALEVLNSPVDALIVMLAISVRLLPQIQAAQTSLQQLNHVSAQYGDLLEVIATLNRHQESAGELSPISLNNRLTLHGVTYIHTGSTEPVFEELSAHIQAGTTVAITGPTGSGKTTLADILAGLTSPSCGSMSVDDTKINHSTRTQWRRKVAYVTQDVMLFHDTLRENLTWVLQKPPDDKVLWKALELVGAENFVRSLPAGLDTIVVDRGINLSGGQRQKLALARAVLSEPELLILDEATSALDQENEEKVFRALESLGDQLTIVIIAHDERSIAHVSQHIEVGH